MQNDAKEEVRARLNIEDVIGEYVQLKRAGRNFKGLSPFSGEKTPSFMVSPDKHIWHDFSSGKGGDIFSFVMEVEGMDFRQALEFLARKAGVELAMYESSGGNDFAKKKQRLLEASELAARYFQQSLLKNHHALEYVFKKRRLSKTIVQDFRIGYAPDDGRGLMQFLSKKGFSKAELAEAGLSNRFGGDLFRGRMTVPLMDSGGQVIGFTARILADDPKAPKYLNTPQTLLYDKSRHVFGLHLAKEAIRKADYAVVVEGNLDVVSSHQAGVRQVVATAGTAMTEQHMRALTRLSQHVRLSFDGDKAGLAATERSIPIAAEAGAELSIVSLPAEFKDPDELIQSDVQAWVKATQDAQPAVDWVISQYEQRLDIKTASGKRDFSSAALAVIKRLPDPVEREHYLGLIAKKLDSSIDAIKAKARQTAQKDKTPNLKPVKTTAHASRDEDLYQDDLLAASLIEASSGDLFHDIDPNIFNGERRRAVAKYLVNRPTLPLSDTPPDLKEYDDYVKILLLRAEERYADFDAAARVHEIAALLRRLETEYKIEQKKNLESQLADAEQNNDDELWRELLSKINSLTKEINSARR